MSITKEIDRLAQAKAAMSLALTEKGVTVSSEDKIDKYASLIKKIPVGTNTSDATANIDEIFAGKTAYVSTGKVTGTFSIDKEIDEQNLDINAIIEALKDKAAGTGEVEEKTINIVKNGTETVEPSLGKSLSKVVINVDTPIPKDEQEKNITIDKNGSYPITPDQGKVLSKVIATVDIPSDKKPEQTYTKTYTQNGTYPIVPEEGKVINGGSILVNTPIKLPEETKTVEIKSNGTTVVVPTPGSVMNKVTINTNTPKPKIEQDKTVQAVKNGPVTVTPDPGKALSKAIVNVAVPSDKKPETAGSEIIKANGKITFNPPAGNVFSSFTADVQVPTPTVPQSQEKEITITENGDYSISPDVNKVLSKVLAHVNVSGGGEENLEIEPFKRVKVMTYVPTSSFFTIMDKSIFDGNPYLVIFTPKKIYDNGEVWPAVLGKVMNDLTFSENSDGWRTNSKGKGQHSPWRISRDSTKILIEPPGNLSVGSTYYFIFLYE